MVHSITILTLNYNGVDLLPMVIPPVEEMAKRAHVKCKVVVVDNSSTDDSVAWLGKNYPSVEVRVMPNEFLFSLNAVVAECASSHILILNNDIIPEADSLGQMLRHFDDDSTFAVSPKLLRWDKTTPDAGRRLACYKNGYLDHWSDFAIEQACPTFFPVGGAFLVRRDRLLEVGGFDRLYRPYYYEDVDLGYQAWARGWQVVYEPQSVMYHKSSASISKYELSQRQDAAEVRGNLLCALKNSDDATFRWMLLHTMRRLASGVKNCDRFQISVILSALSRYPAIRRGRKELRRCRVRSDAEIFSAACGPLGAVEQVR